jgi:hypothetical protein
MEVEEGQLRSGRRFRDFVVYGRRKPELFSARFMEDKGTLQIMWTDSISPKRLLPWLRQAQELAGGPGSVTEITGQASDKLQRLIRAGRFSAHVAAQMLGQKLGGHWRVVVVPRPKSVTWDITATRLGDAHGPE